MQDILINLVDGEQLKIGDSDTAKIVEQTDNGDRLLELGVDINLEDLALILYDDDYRWLVVTGVLFQDTGQEFVEQEEIGQGEAYIRPGGIISWTILQ